MKTATSKQTAENHETTEDGTLLVHGWLRRKSDGGLTVRFKCPGCGQQHHHGWVEDEGATETARSSHCQAEGSYLNGRGYVIRIDPDREPEAAVLVR